MANMGSLQYALLSLERLIIKVIKVSNISWGGG